MKKIFISYCWGESDSFVESLAIKLLNGYEVIFDKWEIKHGHNMDFFMENSIRDADKVFVVCDKDYVRKANHRSSGVGVETSIISPKVYRNNKQEKFIPVFMEGITVKPDYMESIYGIEINSAQKLSNEKIEEFINAIEGKTILQKPSFDKPSIESSEGTNLLLGKVEGKSINEKFESEIYDIEVYEAVKNLIKKDLLSKYLVKYQLYNFGVITLKFDIENQNEILSSIDYTFVEATGYCGWSNYDIFGNIAYYIAMNSANVDIKKKAGNILAQCADIRYNLKNYLEDYEMSML